MSSQSELGKFGEKLASEHLIRSGYAILRKNFVWGKAEVDLIASKEQHIVFVEVKTRMSEYLSDPSLMVPMRKQRHIIKAADAFMKSLDEELPARFDIISVITNSHYTKIDHIEDAFFPTI